MSAALRSRLNAAFVATTLFLSCVMLFLGHTIVQAQREMVAHTDSEAHAMRGLSAFQLAFERMHTLTLRRAAGLDTGIDALHRQQRVLAAAFAECADPHTQANSALDAFMGELDAGLDEVERSPPRARELVGRFEEAEQGVQRMIESARDVERRRVRASVDQVALLRGSMYVSGALLWGNFAAWVALLLLSVRHSGSLIRAQKRALDSEHQAVIAGQQAVTSKNTMLGMISHELRTPLQTIISSIDLLALEHQNHKRANGDVIARLGDASVQLEAQLKDLTDYARLDSHKLSLRHARCDPAAILGAAVAGYLPVAERKGLVLVADIAATGQAIHSDSYRIQQIASNLMSNAIKYSETGEVRVRLLPLQDDGRRLVFSVADTGPGIAAADLPRLFEPFTQIDGSHTRRHDGAGLGLAIVRGLVDLFGGTLRVDSEVGRGSCFEVSLPVTPAAAPDPPPAAAPGREAARPVLLVDDNADVRASLKEVIERLGYSCEVAESGEACLRKTAEQPFSAILLDIQMPRMDGFEVAARVREGAGPNQAVPIVGISAYAHKHHSDEETRPFSRYLLKPIRRERLQEVLQAVLQLGPPAPPNQ